MQIYLQEKSERESIIKYEDASRRNLWIERRKIKDASYRRKKEQEEEIRKNNIKNIYGFIFELVLQIPEFNKYKKIFEELCTHLEDKCPYTVLGLPKNTPLEKCRIEFRKQALLLHPDRNFGLTEEQKKKNLEIFKLKSAAMDMIEKMQF